MDVIEEAKARTDHMASLATLIYDVYTLFERKLSL